jgi:DNA-binding FadR family transcriptional regulator
VAARSAISEAEIRRLRELLELTAVGLVIERMTPRVEKQLRKLAEQEKTMTGTATPLELQRLHMALGEMSGDQALQFLLSIALRVTDERSSFTNLPRAEREGVVSRIKRVHLRIIGAIIERNGALADRRMRQYLAGLKDWLE